METWIPIRGYEGLYDISSLGRVRSLPRETTSGRILEAHGRTQHVNLCKDGKSLRFTMVRLMAQHFPSVSAPPINTQYPHEEWRPVAGYEGLYEVSSAGRVRSLDRIMGMNASGSRSRTVNGRILKPLQGTKGYPMVHLLNAGVARTIKIHRLVAVAFLPNPTNLPQVNHLDKDVHHNDLTNLQWCTNLENAQHSWTAGLRTAPKRAAAESHFARLSWPQVHCIRALASAGLSPVQLARIFPCGRLNISLIIKGKIWKSS